jgi:hypothetical protein
MSGGALLFLTWLAAGLAGAMLAAGVAALLARSLLAACIYVFTSSACAAAAAAVLGADSASLALTAAAGGWAPVILLAGVSLTSRISRSTAGAMPWGSIAGAAALAMIVTWSARGRLAPAPAHEELAYANSGLGLWMAVIALAAGAGCIALLGFGERGALERRSSGGEP